MIFEPAKIGKLNIENRIIRSATFEGMCDLHGFPTQNYRKLYFELAQQNIGAIITGFSFIRNDGRAIQPGQAGIDSLDKVKQFRNITDVFHKSNAKIIMQIAHTGRQTASIVTGENVLGVSNKKSPTDKAFLSSALEMVARNSPSCTSTINRTT